MKVNQVRTIENIRLSKVYADAEVQAQLDPQLSLLTILREKKVYKQAE